MGFLLSIVVSLYQKAAREQTGLQFVPLWTYCSIEGFRIATAKMKSAIVAAEFTNNLA